MSTQLITRIKTTCKCSWVAVPLTTFAFGLSCGALQAQDNPADFVSTVVASHPLGYYRLDATTGKSQVGATTYKSVGTAALAAPGAPVGAASNRFLKLDGKTGYVTTTQSGGIATAGSIMAWVNLAALPSTASHILYVAGESQSGNDFDLQFESDNKIKFFTSGGGSIEYAPAAATLVNQWHMIVVSLDTIAKTRAIYWDGKPVASDKGGGSPNKTAPFSIGESMYFKGRFFAGGIQDVALWNRALKAAEVAAIFAATKVPAPASGAAGAAVGASAAAGSGADTGMFPTTAKVELKDSKGAMKLKRPEQIAFMFLSAIQMIEGGCQTNQKRACSFDQLLPKLKYDPRTDPNYTYTVVTLGTAWEAHATAKKPGLMGYCFLSRSYPTIIATFSPSGTAGFIDSEFMETSIEGDSFMK